MLSQDLKKIINQIPDNLPITIGQSDCCITGFSFDTADGFVRLRLTDGFGITTDDFIATLFELLKKVR